MMKIFASSLRLQALLGLGLLGVCLMLVLGAVVPHAIQSRFDQQEAQHVRQDTTRARRAVEAELQGLSASVQNFSAWDDSYVYIQNRNRAYETSNFAFSTFAGQRLNLIMYLNPRGEVVSARAYDLQRSRFEPADQVARQVRAQSDALLQLRDVNDHREGLLLLPAGPILLAARPIVTSANTGPIQGTLIMGRLLTTELLGTLALDTQLSLSWQPARSDLIEQVGQLPDGVAIQAAGERTINGLTLLTDLDGEPTVALRVSQARDIHQNGLVTARNLLLAVLAVVLAFTVCSLLLLELLVLSKLTRYRRAVGRMDHDLSRRLPSRGENELSVFARAVNGLLDRVQGYQNQLLVQAQHDDLTGLPNRRLFQERLEAWTAEAEPLALAIVDLNGFKYINDTKGHHVGDEVLRQVAGRFCLALGQAAPVPDAPAPPGPGRGPLVVRTGGDEFAFLLPGAYSEASALLLVQTALRALELPLPSSAGELYVGASAGVVLSPRDGQAPPLLVQRADIAMYRAKAAGEGVLAFTPEFSKWVQERADIERHLRGALAGGELSLVFQPIVELGSAVPSAAEALLRWHSPELGTVTPDRLIPVAEDSGLIREIGTWVLSEACARAGGWHAAGLTARVAVNVSATQLGMPDFAEGVGRILRDTGLPPHLLELEVTESAVMHRLDLASQHLTKLRLQGVSVSLDDFGTGYSSLALLRSLPIDQLKLDRAFTLNVERNGRQRAVASAVVNMAHDLAVQVVAEGIETAAQREVLASLGCPLGQGYLFARPLPHDEWVAYLSSASVPAKPVRLREAQ